MQMHFSGCIHAVLHSCMQVYTGMYTETDELQYGVGVRD